MKIGYARRSTAGQEESLATQTELLEAEGCERVFTDTISGAKSKRPGLDDALSHLRTDDVLVVTRLDRLGRTARDTLVTVADLAEQGVSVLILEPRIDTRDPIGKLLVSVLAGLAEWERDLLIARTKEGVAHARSEGRVGGRPPTVTPSQRRAIRKMVRDGQTISEVARTMGVSRSTVYRMLDRAA